MHYVYILQSLRFPNRRYVGLTNNLTRRLTEHNAGKSHYTSKYLPWKLLIAIRFENRDRACQFERYLKSGSGRAFANRHFL